MISKACKAEFANLIGYTVTIGNLDPAIVTDFNGLNQRILAESIDLCGRNNNSFELAV
ncbi:MAG: Uncharacterised protein [SAR116 cluster bacterium]|nr:MAG: Uncharacterised protein [SAR116 cluster bacterium]